MILSFFILSLISFSIIGYSYIFKKIISNDKNFIFNSIDFLYGYFFLILFVSLVHFIFPLKYFIYPVLLIGIFLFYFFFTKIILTFNLKLILLLILVILFITADHDVIRDGSLYLTQLVKWPINEKVVFGLINLEYQYGKSNIYTLLISIFNFNYNNFDSLYIFNILNYVFILNFLFNRESNKNFSEKIFLFFCLIFIFFYSFIHPAQNGYILNYIGSADTDTVAMIYFILSCYLFIEYKKKNSDYFFQLLLISSSICFFSKVSNISILLLPIYLIYKNYKLAFHNNNSILLLAYPIYFLRNIITNGCFVFPVKITCLDFLNWSYPSDLVERWNLVIKSFARSAPTRVESGNFEFTIYSYDWLMPWLKGYVFSSSFTQIIVAINIINILLIIFFLVKKKNFLLSKYKELNFLFLLSFIIWFQAPEDRFGFGFLIFFSLFYFVIYFKQFFKLSTNFYKNSLALILIFLCFKNYQNYVYFLKIDTINKNFDFSKFENFTSTNNINIYKNRAKGGFCYDFEKICVINEKKKYTLTKKLGYLIFEKSYE